MINFFSYRSDFVIKEAQTVKIAEGQRNTWFNRAMTLCQPGCKLKRNLGLFLLLSINDE